MKTPFITAAAAALVLAGCGQSNNSSGTNPTPASAPANYVGALGSAQNKALKTVDNASLNEAVQMFFNQEGRYPTSLNELVEKQFINSVPDAPPGMRIDYDPNTGKVRVVPQ